jgi:FkbM family methyltransferase
LQKHISNTKPVIIEAGIHRGEDTKIFQQIWPESRIYGFEPDPRNIEFITNSDIANLPGLMFFGFALSDTVGTTTLYLSDMQNEVWAASSSLNAPKEHLRHFPQINFDKQVIVATTTLDNIIPECEVIDIIWLDVQGHELNVLKGGKNTLSRTKLLYLEYYNVEMYEGQPRVKDLMTELGPDWEIVEIWPSELLLRNKKNN